MIRLFLKILIITGIIVCFIKIINKNNKKYEKISKTVIEKTVKVSRLAASYTDTIIQNVSNAIPTDSEIESTTVILSDTPVKLKSDNQADTITAEITDKPEEPITFSNWKKYNYSLMDNTEIILDKVIER